MNKPVKWIGLSLLVYLVFLVVKLPAVFALSQLTLPNNLSLYQVSGTLWQGRASQVSYQNLAVNQVEWELSAWSLLLGKVSAQVKGGNIRQADEISISGHVSLSQQQIGAEKLKLYLPANSALINLPLPVPLKAQGRLVVGVDQLAYELATGCETLQGKGQWLNAQVDGVNKVIDLGNFEAQLSCEQSSVVLSVQEPNSLGLSAKVNIPANFKFSVKGQFKPAQNLPLEVHQAAEFFGAANQAGYYPIAL